MESTVPSELAFLLPKLSTSSVPGDELFLERHESSYPLHEVPGGWLRAVG